MKPLITAHTGCEGTAPNSMASLEMAVAAGADIAEMDVRMDFEGVLRANHNELLTQAEYERCLKITDILGFMRLNNICVNFDIKETRCIPPLLKLADEYGFGKNRIIMTGSVNIHALACNPQWTQKAQIYWNIEEMTDDMPVSDMCAKYNVEGINVPQKYITDEVCDMLNITKLPVSVWTVDDADKQRIFMNNSRVNIVNITTRNVVSAIQIRKELYKCHV